MADGVHCQHRERPGAGLIDDIGVHRWWIGCIIDIGNPGGEWGKGAANTDRGSTVNGPTRAPPTASAQGAPPPPLPSPGGQPGSMLNTMDMPAQAGQMLARPIMPHIPGMPRIPPSPQMPLGWVPPAVPPLMRPLAGMDQIMGMRPPMLGPPSADVEWLGPMMGGMTQGAEA